MRTPHAHTRVCLMSVCVQVQQKLEKQNKRRFLQKGIRFNILIVGESRSGKTTLRKKMFESVSKVTHTSSGIVHVFSRICAVAFDGGARLDMWSRVHLPDQRTAVRHTR